MRKKFIEAESREEAIAQAPWAANITKVEGGWQAFESQTDKKTWKDQK